MNNLALKLTLVVIMLSAVLTYESAFTVVVRKHFLDIDLSYICNQITNTASSKPDEYGPNFTHCGHIDKPILDIQACKCIYDHTNTCIIVLNLVKPKHVFQENENKLDGFWGRYPFDNWDVMCFLDSPKSQYESNKELIGAADARRKNSHTIFLE
jgi:hypothetical protein